MRFVCELLCDAVCGMCVILCGSFVSTVCAFLFVAYYDVVRFVICLCVLLCVCDCVFFVCYVFVCFV